MHCYSSSVEMMKRFINLGCYISLGGPVTFKNAVTPKEVAKQIPLDRLLIETDSPYLAPVPYRGKRNETSYVKRVAVKLAELYGVEIGEVERQTTVNALKLFKIH